jgi:integrase/recombinase XerD
MSGGPYGRGKAPERACMKKEHWPEEDRRSFDRACRPADPFAVDGGGSRASHSDRSNHKLEVGYGRYLTFLTLYALAALQGPLAQRVTPELVRSFIKHLEELGNSTRTQLCRLQELGEMAKVFSPEADWSFINKIASRVRAKNVPARDKSNLRLSDDLLELGLELMTQARNINGRKAAVLFRDGLIIAFLALVPVRRRNLADFKMGRNLIDRSQTLLIIFDESETKTHAPIEVEWPECLIDPLEEYLTTHRPLLESKHGRWYKPADDFLWLSQDGSPLTQMAIYDRIRERTRVKFGNALNPHLFRDAAATTMAIADPAHVRLAAPLLGHRTFSTTEKYYQQAKTYEAHQAYMKALFGKDEE